MSDEQPPTDPADADLPPTDDDTGWDGEPEGTNPDSTADWTPPDHWSDDGAPQERLDAPGAAPTLVRVPSDDSDVELVYYPDGHVEERERTRTDDGDVPDLDDADPFDPDAAEGAFKGLTWVSTNVPRKPLWTPPQAVYQARLQVTHDTCPHYNGYYGLCLHFTACMYGFGSSGTYDAISMWRLMPEKYCHYEDHTPPVGALVMWQGGSAGHGHISIVVGYSNGSAMIASNDIRRSGHIDIVPLSAIQNEWGEDYKGWTPPYFARGNGTNGQTKPDVGPEKSPWAKGEVYVSKLHMGQEHSDSVRRLKHRLTHHDDVPDHFQKGIDTSTGTYSTGVRDAVRWWQRNVADNRTAPQDGEYVSAAQANRLFGDKYRVIEPAKGRGHASHHHHGGH